jgi:hypothetical protein
MNIKIKSHNLAAFVIAAASVVLLGTVDGAIINKWFVMGEQTIKSTDPSVEIKTTGGRWNKDVKAGKALCRGR